MKGKFVRFVHPPRLKFDYIRTKADEFRQRYVNPPNLLPIPIVEIVELQLGIMPIPILRLKDKEAGHYVLHKKEIQECDFRTAEDWIHFHEDFLEEDLNWFAQHAYEFAGRLLVPRDALIAEIRALSPKLREIKKRAGDDEENIIQAVSRVVCNKFQVSPEVIARRIRIEKAWPTN